MENRQYDNLIVDTLWNVVNNECNYYNKKINVISYIFGNIIDTIPDVQNQLSNKAKRILFENTIVKYFNAVRNASIETISNDETATNYELGGIKLNKRGFARLSVLSNISADVEYSPKTNKNIYLALGNVLKHFSMQKTDFEGKGLFEVIYKYIENHPTLKVSQAKAVSNSFCSNIENDDIMLCLDVAFHKYLDSRIEAFKQELRAQNCDEMTINILPYIIEEVDKNYNMFTPNVNSVLNLNLGEKIIQKYKSKL